MGIFSSLNERRVPHWLGVYLAAGFLALEGVDQLVGHAMIPGVGYRIALIFYVGGVPATFILAWFHGRKGPQRPPAAEVWLLSAVALIALGSAGFVIKDYLATRARDLEAVELGLDPRRLAVLYFDDLSRDHALGYLADGLTEALIDKLSQVRALEVVSRNGVAPYRGSEAPRDSIARDLEAGTVIAGSIEPAEDRLRVTARLVDGTSGADIQRGSFELPAADLLAISDSLAGEVSRFLRERLGEEVRLRERRAATSNTDAWALVQRAERVRKDGEMQARQGEIDATFAAFERADSILALAEALDPTWSVPVVLRGQIAYRRARLDLEYWGTLAATALAHAQRALDLAPNDGEALELKGTLEYASWLFERPPDPGEAGRLLEQARSDLEESTRVDPTLASAHSTLSHLYYQVDDVPAVVLAARRAYEEDAYLELADVILWRLFNASLDLEQFPQAERWCLEGAKRFPQNYRFVFCQLMLLVTPTQQPDVDLAWELAARIDSLAPEQWADYEHVDGLMTVAGVIARAGLPDSGRAVLARARPMVTHEIDPEQSFLSREAFVLMLLGDHDQAVEVLKRYVAANPGHFEGGGSIGWMWRPLQSHPGFQELVGGG
jgi:serine/threonine-protein kinase